MKNRLVAELLTAAKEAPRLYFSPLMGAIQATRAEFQRVSKHKLEKK